MKHLEKIKDWHSPSFLIWLLTSRVNELKEFYTGMSDIEFDRQCKTDIFFRKNLELEMRDLETVIRQLKKLLL